MYHDLIIIGGGSCGMASAIKAKDLGIDVSIIDGSDRLGKKLLTTGNGRCNLTNENLTLDRFHSDNNNFFKDIITKFNLDDALDFFKSIGIYTCTLDSKKIYPISLQASSVVDILRMNLSERNIPTYMNSKVLNIIKDKNNMFNIITDSNTYTCKKVLLCTGGKSYTKSGSDGSGYKLAKNFGHKIIPTTPGIVQLKLNHDKLKAISGVKFQSFCSISINDETRRREFGEILFTDYGISGPPVLQLSRIASRGVLNKDSVYLHVNLMNLSYDDILNFFENHFGVFSHRSISDNLIGIINKKLIPVILKEVGIIDIHMPTYSVEYEHRYKLYKLLSNWTFKVTDTNSFENAQVTLGGVDTNDVNNLTLESTLIPGLYFAGEILDVDGDCGGFNLQWCWSSSSAVTSSIYQSLKK
ncbi:NAD(P)/FAD-dependent oxidoreductase [Clostridium sp.]|uniref:NAD(P)/FAD-dependent oxidoreductase n=1 Tax=Clostridium sp. TaxID=1506 RepID=UPI003216936F